MPDDPQQPDLQPIDYDPFSLQGDSSAVMASAPAATPTPPTEPAAPAPDADQTTKPIASIGPYKLSVSKPTRGGILGQAENAVYTGLTGDPFGDVVKNTREALSSPEKFQQAEESVGSTAKSLIFDPMVSAYNTLKTIETGQATPEQEADFGAATATQMVFGGIGGAEEGAAGVAGGKLMPKDVPVTAPEPLPKTASPSDNPARIDQRIPTAKTPVEAAGDGPRTVDLDAMKLTPDLYDHNVGLVRDYPGVNIPKNYGTDKAADTFVNQAADNLVWLHNQVPEDIRNRSSLWYDGGNKIANDFADKYGVTDSQAAGAIAAMSPQKDWYNNVSLADRVLNTAKNVDTPFSPEMDAAYRDTPALMKYPQFYDQIKDKSLSDIDQMVPFPKDERAILKSMWIRLHDQAHGDPSVYKVSPEGNIMPEVSQNVAWGSLPEISKAVSIIDGGDVSDLVGKRNKVRNFYNNILTPNSPEGDVTIDTHAVGAALLRPFTSQSTEVGHNFGNSLPKDVPIENAKNSAKTGIWGTYPLYAEAHRRAADQLGILPRQLQSITWEAVRGLFPEGWKNAKNSAIIDNIWRQSKKVGIDETRQRILNAAGGIKPPTWLVDERNQQIRDAGRARLGARAPDASAQGAGNAPELPGRGVYGTGTESAIPGAGSGTPGSLAEKVNEPAAEATGTSERGVVGRGGVGPASGTPEDAVGAAQATAERVAAGRQKLVGLPDQPIKSAGNFVPGPVGYLHDIAEQYMHDEGFDYNPPKTYQPVDPQRASRIADAFDQMKHDPSDPRVGASYRALVQETLAQYDALKQAGVKFDFIKPGMEDPYKANPRLAAKDVVDNKHLWVYPTDTGFGTDAAAREAIKDNPLLAPTDEYIDGKRLLANDVFRIVHDMFGHFKDGNGFRAGGEENAWRSHSAMYSDLARPAMTSETRGQNSWLNYGPHGEKNRTASAADTTYADQKVGRLPDWVMEEGRHDPVDLQPVEHDPFKTAATLGQMLASGGTVDPYADFRRSQNIVDDTNESAAEKLYDNFMANVTGKNDNWISDTSNWLQGNAPQAAPVVPPTTNDPLASSLGYNDIPGRARGGRALPEKYGTNHIDYAFDINRWGMYDKHGYLIKSGSIKDEVSKRAHGGRVEPLNIHPNPTEAQKHAGNYAKDHIHFQGMPITIENAKGSTRRGVGPSGKPWESVLPAHYGYINRTDGADGDHVDCYIGPHSKASHVFIVDQVDHTTKRFDEHKCMLGFGTERQALLTYQRGFSDGKGKDRVGKITAIPVAQFRHWLQKGDTKNPFGTTRKVA